ncbi:MAG TPA: SH3 domain-containing protein [Oligoflexia bacterium]|nr:SH3 domain-containing protein [Oligoflexia bacterium]
MENSFFREIVQILRVNGPFGCLFVVCFLFSPLISEAKPISASSVSVEAESSVLSTEAQKGKGLVFVRRPTLKNDKGEQLTSKDNSRLAEVIEESRLLKEHREVLIQYTKELRDKYQKLQKFCLQSSDGVCNKEDSDSQKEKKQIEAKVTFEPQNFYKEELALLKSEIDKITSAKKELQKNLEDKSKEYSDIQKKYELLESELSAVKAELESARNQSRDIGEKSSGEVGKLKSDLEQKENEARECLVHLEKSQELVSKIPDFERDILALKNELLIRKSAEELLDPGSSSGRAVSVNEKVNTASPVKPGSSSRADDASGRQQVGSSDVTILEVTGNKVSLRAGPGLNHSSLMDIQSGAKLLVEAREGEWYRVTAPTGGRAYIHSNYGR